LDDKLTIKYKKYCTNTLCHQSSFLKYVLEITSLITFIIFTLKNIQSFFITHYIVYRAMPDSATYQIQCGVTTATLINYAGKKC
jgi:hypothetical protein